MKWIDRSVMSKLTNKKKRTLLYCLEVNLVNSKVNSKSIPLTIVIVRMWYQCFIFQPNYHAISMFYKKYFILFYSILFYIIQENHEGDVDMRMKRISKNKLDESHAKFPNFTHPTFCSLLFLNLFVCLLLSCIFQF